jgi:hypothetical protein
MKASETPRATTYSSDLPEKLKQLARNAYYQHSPVQLLAPFSSRGASIQIPHYQSSAMKSSSSTRHLMSSTNQSVSPPKKPSPLKQGGKHKFVNVAETKKPVSKRQFLNAYKP